ncbi:MAG: aminopeptidase N [Sphingomonadales bacterium]|nr:aminopeptidase N [Sphingomonadales bacterium]
MNIASTPPAPTVIHRADYRPPEWLVPEVTLAFNLGLEETRVVATLKVKRNADNPVLRLLGDGLTAEDVLVDGEPHNAWRMDGPDLLIDLPGAAHEVSVATRVNPAANTQLMGLYASNGMLCTQCEAEGFRRITFFPDRPDVLSVYTVHMEGPKAQFPVLLSNGDCIARGDGEGEGAHFATWHDPWPKPSYLFALVAGDLVANHDTFTTMSGRKVDLNIWVRDGDQDRTHHAMQALKDSMKWDEDVFGREYDLGLFNIVAVSDFNMGAMENKGLNVFNTRYILADPDTATDLDYDGIEGVVAHEYFHNWSGNRVTCRDWFQLSLKEGFTVLRDQLFSQDMGSAAVKRIEDVRTLRGAQFPEDSGPLAHPIRPDSYQEISNFYTATVYNKGAEVIRMMRTLVGADRFRAGTDLYFARHDGEAATCEDFVKAIEDGAGIDLGQFRLWYSQAGTPRVTARLTHQDGVARLSLRQEVPPTPGQPDKKPMVIPLRLALFDPVSGRHDGEKLVVLDRAEMEFAFPGFTRKPVLSLGRGFSAPVAIDSDTSREDLMFLAASDDDPFARYEALQQLTVQHLLTVIAGDADQAGAAAICDAMRKVIADPALDDLMRGELLTLPGEAYLAEQFDQADPGAIRAAREALKAGLSAALQGDLMALHARASAVPYSLSPAARGARKVKTLALVLLAAGAPQVAATLASAQYDAADNMTDRQGALMVLCGLDTPLRDEKLAAFYARFADNALVVDKWFSLQAGSLHPRVLDHVRTLADHAAFTLTNPNRVRALYMAAAVNPGAFHDAAGAGYRMIADLILALDPINPQTAARFVAPLGRWRRIEPGRAALMRAELQRIAAASGLSKDTAEQVSKSLD